MIRVFLWKVLFEWHQVLRIISPRSHQRRHYFAFGANLSADVMRRRRIKVYRSYDFKLQDAALRFSQLGFYQDHGYASADHCPGQVVYGKIYEITDRDAARMDYYEGLPFLRVHHKVETTQDGVEFFYYRSVTPCMGLKPTKEYLSYLVNAYREMESVPVAYLDEMEKTETLEHLRPQNRTGKYVHDISRWPAWSHWILTQYEWWCQRTVVFLWNRSMFQWLIH